MNNEQAKRMIQDALGEAFDKTHFVRLVKNILNHVQDAPFTYTGNLIFDDFEDSIRRVDRIGKYRTPDKKQVDILIVHLKKETSLERARTKQRNYVAKYLKGSRGGEFKDAALVAFVAPNEEDWRFSFVKVEYVREQRKATEKFTPARRYSFLVGPNEKSHTAQSRLLPVLLKNEDPTLDYLEEIFSVEPVTKEFFEKYRDLFLRLKEQLDKVLKGQPEVESDFTERGIDTADFAKKLLGQIVFLYFLQKKGWFGVKRGEKWGEGSKNFLRELFEKKHRDYQNFFNDILEPLFYEALRLKRPKDYYSQFDCRIPFLNGGLFDPLNNYDWEDTDILLPDSIFSNNNWTKEGDIGDGILDIFDRYNFTVNENEPLEKEVAVDPEMLGKVFENLLPVKDRKSSGTYYTPREIVHYMCRKSLINHLVKEFDQEIDKDDIEALVEYADIAVENEYHVANKDLKTRTYAFKMPEDIREHADLLDEELDLIRVCDPAVGSGAFLVGMMNEIVRVRSALTPYIDNSERSPYKFKRQAIEYSLYGVDIDPSAVEIAKLRLWLSLVVDEEDRSAIKPLPNLDFKIIQGNSLFSVKKDLFNNDLFNRLEELESLFFNETDPDQKQEYREQRSELINQITGGLFDFEVYFSRIFREKQGFDVVIANPPYVSAVGMPQDERERIKKELSQYDFLVRRWDLYVAFIAKGHQILSTNGNLTYIVPNPILKELYALKLRRWLLEYTILTSILAFNDVNVFENVSRRTTVFNTLKTRSSDSYKILIFGNDGDVIRLTNEVNSDDWLNEPRHIFSISGNVADAELLNKIDGKSMKVANYFYVSYGAQVLSKEKGKFLKKDVVGNIPQGNPKRFFEGRDVKKWQLSTRNLWLDYRENEMYSPRFPGLFEADKIVVRKVSDKNHRLAVALDQSGSYTDDGNTLIVPYTVAERAGLSVSTKGLKISNVKLNLKYALALLLSNLETFYFKGRFATESLQGASSHTYPNSVRGLPIVELSPDEQKPFIEIVDKILAITGTDDYLQNSTKQAQVREYEKQIDKLVYDLYDLTPGEIKIIEEATNPK